jgi:ligand-binding sensor domain-containing protein
VHPFDSDIVFAGTWDGLYKSANRGQSWARVDSGWTYPQVSAIAFDPVRGDVIYVGTKGSGIFKSIDNGETWRSKNQGLDDYTIWSIATDPQNSDTVFAGCDIGIYRTYDGAESTWTRVHWAQRSALAIDPKNSRNIFAGRQYNDLHKSIDRGDSWILGCSQGITTGGPESRLQWVVVDIDDSQMLYVGSNTVGFYKSTNSAGSWQAFNAGLDNRNIRVIVQDPARASMLHVATANGVFISDDAGGSWEAMNTGLSEDDLDVRALAIDPAQPEILYAGTWDSGVFVWATP